MSLDSLLHVIGFGLVIALWLTALVGIGEICRKLRAALAQGQPPQRAAAAIKKHVVAFG